jgi:large subunit ribosomal protein L6
MSRVGKQPVTIPSGVKTALKDRSVRIEGPKGTLEHTYPSTVEVVSEKDQLIVKVKSDSRQARADYGTVRAHINNMVLGVTKGWKKALELNGVGFNAKLAGQTLTLAVGYSHDVKIEIPKAIKCTVGKTNIDLESADKELLGTLAANIRKTCPPEPYLGKGIKYSDETIRRKAGKTGKK